MRPRGLTWSTRRAPASSETMSDYLAELFEAGLITRAPNPADGRSYLIRPTAKGCKAFERGSVASSRA
jgi:DNA-binding MarR family transcriptional regulator